MPDAASSGGPDGLAEGACIGCGLPPTVTVHSVGVFGIHGDGQRGNTRCPWVFAIRVALVQMARARGAMRPHLPSFAAALRSKCSVEWAWSPAAMGAADAVAPCVRLPPEHLLDWGRTLDGQPSREFAQWLTSGTALPKIVHFAPVLARALGVAY